MKRRVNSQNQLLEELKQENAQLKQQIDTLTENQQYYRLLAENVTDPIWTTDLKLNFTYLSPAVKSAWGYTPQEALKLNAGDILTPASYRLAAKTLKAELKEEKNPKKDPLRNRTLELEHYHKNGFLFWAEVKMTFLRAKKGEVVGILGVSRDITERKLAEAALTEERNKLEKVTQSIGVGLAIISRNYRTLWANAVIKQIFGEVEGKICYSTYNQRDQVCPGCGVKEIFLTGKDQVVHEQSGMDSQGNPIWSQMIATSIKDQDGKTRAALEVVVPITERKRAEERLLALNRAFLNLGPDFNRNINLLTKTCGEILGASCALYNRLKDSHLYAAGQWQAPAGFKPLDKAEGHICYDVIKRGKNCGLYLVNNLPATPYYKTDPNVAAFNLKTYAGYPVICQGEPVGSLCVVFQKELNFTPYDEMILGILASAIGIEEERKAAQEAIQKFKTIADKANYGVAIVDLQGNYRYCNEYFAGMHGYQPEELIGKHLSLFASPKQLLKVKQLSKILHKSGSFSLQEVWRKHKNGSHFPALMNGVMLKDEKGTPLFMAATVIDITARKQVEEALEKSELQQRALLNAIPDMIFILDRRGVFLDYIPAKGIKPILPAGEFLGKKIAEILPPEVARKAGPYIKKSFKTGKIQVFEYQLQDKAGESHFEARLSLSGKDQLLAIVRDITERKSAERELLAYQQQLQSLASKLVLAEESERRRIAIELHDRIGQSLAITRLKLGSLKPGLEAAGKQAVLAEIDKLIEQIIQSARNLSFELSPPVLYELGFAAAVEWLTEQMQEQYGINFYLVNELGKKQLDSDIRVLLFQAVRELLLNIAKHARAVNAWVALKQEGKNIKITVEDDGVGIDRSKPKKTGGFGLFSIRERLANLGGEFQLESRQGKGTRVTIRAPLSLKTQKTGRLRK